MATPTIPAILLCPCPMITPAQKTSEKKGSSGPINLFFPKVYRYISHLKWLSDIEEIADDFIDSI